MHVELWGDLEEQSGDRNMYLHIQHILLYLLTMYNIVLHITLNL